MVTSRRSGLILLALVLSVPLGAGCLASPFRVILSAPTEDTGFAVTVATSAPNALVSYRLMYRGLDVYPGLGDAATLQVSGGHGSAFVPYARTVRGNGLYTVVASDGVHQDRASVEVRKWVASVYLIPYERNGSLVVEAVLESSPGSHLQGRVITRGNLVLELRYRGQHGEVNETGGILQATSAANATYTRVTVPLGNIPDWKGSGWYEVLATFSNDEAVDNNRVGNDPGMAATNPPENWVYLR